MNNRGIVGIDVHKSSKPKIPEMVGISMLIGFSMSLVFLSIATPESSNTYLAVLISIVVAALIGLFDDFKDLSPTLKMLLAMLSGFPIIALRVYNPRPIIPF
ncbi:MAG: hypothetical protein QW201_01485, partial [Thermoproteota archaeon]